ISQNWMQLELSNFFVTGVVMRFGSPPGTNYVIRHSLLRSLGGWDPSALTEESMVESRKDLTRISDLNSISEWSDRGFHQYSCGCERDRDIPEVDTQWVKPQTGPFRSPSTPLSRSISKVRALLPMVV